MKLIAVTSNPRCESTPYLDNVNQWAKLVYKFRANLLLARNAIRSGVPITELLVTRFPFCFADRLTPPSVHIELTDACNLRCVYCNNPYFPHPRKIMSWDTLHSVITSLRVAGVGRICVGGGEPTLHPHFAQFVSEIRSVAKILTVVSNGQWETSETAKAMLETPFDLIEISVDAGLPSDYERSRPGASFEKLMRNIILLNELKRSLHARSQINIRLMLRPSQRSIEATEKIYWKRWCDSVMPQYVVQPDNVPQQDDVYLSQYAVAGSYPRCTLPFRNLQVRANGDVPLCQKSGSNSNRRLILGNVRCTSVLELWNGPVMRHYRRAHRTGETAAIPICKGCIGC